MYLHPSGPWRWQAAVCHRSGSLVSPAGVSAGCGVPRAPGSGPVHVPGRGRSPALLLVCCPGAQWGQLPWGTLFLLHKGSQQLPSFPMGKMCVERRNFPVSVTDSQGFGSEGLLRGWPGFLLTYSLSGRFLPVFLERSHAEMLAFFCQASNGLWYRMDDESVQLRCLDTALRQQAYLLFYAR